MYDAFTELLNTPAKLSMARHLADIEAQDRNVCAHCGGEDCVCCEIYQDRNRWQDPEEFFSDENWY